MHVRIYEFMGLNSGLPNANSRQIDSKKSPQRPPGARPLEGGGVLSMHDLPSSPLNARAYKSFAHSCTPNGHEPIYPAVGTSGSVTRCAALTTPPPTAYNFHHFCE
jgi:hypothetical protein